MHYELCITNYALRIMHYLAPAKSQHARYQKDEQNNQQQNESNPGIKEYLPKYRPLIHDFFRQIRQTPQQTGFGLTPAVITGIQDFRRIQYRFDAQKSIVKLAGILIAFRMLFR